MAEAVKMVMDRCKTSVRTEAEACTWLTEQVVLGRLKLLRTERSPEHPYGKARYLDGEDFIFIPCFPGAQAIDEIDWAAGKLRRWVRWPRLVGREGKDIDPATLTDYERQQVCSNIIFFVHEIDPTADNGSPPAVMTTVEREARFAALQYRVKEWLTEELTYPFTVKRASLSAVLDTVSRDIPVADRAEGEPGECGCWRDSAEEQEAAQTAPDLLAAYRAKMRTLPRLIEERRRSFEGGSLDFINHDYEAAIKAELRAALKEHFDRQLRAGMWICCGFSEERGARIRIGSPWRDGLSFDDAGDMTDKRGGHYSDVLFYRSAELPREPIVAQPPPAPPKPLLSQNKKAKLRHRLKDFLERETRIDPPRARTKAEWLQSARQEFGAELVTYNLFEEVWRDADLPVEWRAPGRRT